MSGEDRNDDAAAIKRTTTLPSTDPVTSKSQTSPRFGSKKTPKPASPSDDDGDPYRDRGKSLNFSNHSGVVERPSETGPLLPSAYDAAILNETPAITMGMHIADYSVEMPDLEKMRTFPSSVPLPDLDGDLEFLDFFDPFLGLPPKQVEALALPPLGGNTDGWSPLENFSASSQTSVQDYGFQQTYARPSKDAQMIDGMTTRSLDTSRRPTSQLDHNSARWDESPNQGPSSIASECENSSIPRLHSTRSSKTPALAFTEKVRSVLMEDLSRRLSSEQLSNFRLPSALALQKCIRTYVDAFHVHLPIFHLQTMDLELTPSPLVLAICAIGALYRLERKVAASLYLKADQALAAATADRGAYLHKKSRLLEDWIRPPLELTKSHQELLWLSQTRLLLMMLRSFSGDMEMISKAIGHLGDFLIVSLGAGYPRVKIIMTIFRTIAS